MLKMRLKQLLVQQTFVQVKQSILLMAAEQEQQDFGGILAQVIQLIQV